jgi:hypothetical protein
VDDLRRVVSFLGALLEPWGLPIFARMRRVREPYYEGEAIAARNLYAVLHVMLRKRVWRLGSVLFSALKFNG